MSKASPSDDEDDDDMASADVLDDSEYSRDAGCRFSDAVLRVQDGILDDRSKGM